MLEQVQSLLPRKLTDLLQRVMNSSIGRRLVRGTFWATVGALCSKAIAVVSAVIVARLLGKAGFGELGVVQSTILLFQSFAGLALGITVTKCVAQFRVQEPARAGRIVALSSSVAFIMGLVFAVVMFFSAGFLAEVTLAAPQLTLTLQISAITLLLGSINGAQIGTLSGLEAFQTLGKATAWSGLFTFLCLVIGVWGYGLTGGVIGLCVGMLASIIQANFAVRGELRRAGITVSFRECPREWRVLYRFSLPAMFTGIMVMPVNWTCNAILVNHPGGIEEMGLYNAANQWFTVIIFLPGMVGQVILPILAERISNNDARRIRKLMLICMAMNVAMCVPLAALLCLASGPIMGLYGAGFAQGWLALVLVVVTGCLIAIQMPVSALIVACDRMWIGFLSNVAWALVFIPLTWAWVDLGAVGLAGARMVAYAAHLVWTLVVGFRLSKRNMEPVAAVGFTQA